MSETTPYSTPDATSKDLRLNQIDLHLRHEDGSQRPGAARELAERLLDFILSHLEPDETLARFDLLYPEEKESRIDVNDDGQGAYAEAMSDETGSSGERTLDDSGELASIEADMEPSRGRLSMRQVRRLAPTRFSGLVAATYDHDASRARSKRFAGILNAYLKKRETGVVAEGIAVLGPEWPEGRLGQLRQTARDLSEGAERQGVLSRIERWGDPSLPGKRRYGVRQDLNRLLNLAFRVHLRDAALEGDAAEEHLGMLLGEELMVDVGDKQNQKRMRLLGYGVELSINDRGVLVVQTPKRAQRIPDNVAKEGGVAQHFSNLAPGLVSLTMARSNRLDARRYTKGLKFGVLLGSEGGREERLQKAIPKKGRDKALEADERLVRQFLTSGLVVKNRIMDQVEAFLASVHLKEGSLVPLPRRFQPTLARQVGVSGHRDAPEYVFLSVPRVQVVLDPELARDPSSSKLTEIIEAALSADYGRHTQYSHAPAGGGLQPVRVDRLERVDPAWPVLYLAFAESISGKSGADDTTSIWFCNGQDRRLLNHFWSALEKVSDEHAQGDFDPYTRLKLDQYMKEDLTGWRAMQCLNITAEHLAACEHDRRENLTGQGGLYDEAQPAAMGEGMSSRVLVHEMRKIRQELRLKYLLANHRSIPLTGAVAARQWWGGQSAQGYIALFARAPSRAPARAAAIHFRLESGELRIQNMGAGIGWLEGGERQGKPNRELTRLQLCRALTSAVEPLDQPRLLTMLDEMAGHEALQDGVPLASEQVMLYSVSDQELLVQALDESARMEPLGATRCGINYHYLVMHGKHPDGSQDPHLGRTVREGRVALAAQLVCSSSAKSPDVWLQPGEREVATLRALYYTNNTVDRNATIDRWRVLAMERPASGKPELRAVAAPHDRDVFHTHLDLMTRNLIKDSQVSRMSIAEKLTRLLVEN